MFNLLFLPGARLLVNTKAGSYLPCRTIRWVPGQGVWVPVR